MNNITTKQYNIIKQRCSYLTKSLYLDDLIQEVALVISNIDEEIYLELSECYGKYVKYIDKVAYRMFVGRSIYNKQVHGNYQKNKDIFAKDYIFDLDIFVEVDNETLEDKLKELISLNVFSSKDVLFINTLISNDWNVKECSLNTGVSESAFRYRIMRIKEKIKSYDGN